MLAPEEYAQVSDMNEIEAAALAAKRVREAADQAEREKKAGPKDSGSWPLVPIGIGIGIGSAALAAALLYARGGRKDRNDPS